MSDMKEEGKERGRGGGGGGGRGTRGQIGGHFSDDLSGPLFSKFVCGKSKREETRADKPGRVRQMKGWGLGDGWAQI